MSLASDMSMYYRSTYIGYRHSDDRVYPFYVQEVHGSSDSNDYSQETMNALSFYGVVYFDNREENRSVELGGGELVLELPELGYIKVNGRPRWLTYRPIQQASKGLSSRRVVGSSMNAGIAKLIYKALHEQPDNLARQFCFHNNEVLYKGMKVGNYAENDVVLKAPYRYLSPYLSKAFPDMIVTVGEEV